jgi:cytidylate kinase
MKTKSRSLEQIVERQVQRWQLLKKERPEKTAAPVITFSREPGSGGRLIAETLAKELSFDIFHQELIHQIAKSAHVHHQLLDTIDEKGMNALEEWVSSLFNELFLVNENRLMPDKYLKHLMKMVGIIGRHGGAVLVGRGSNFILPPERRLRLRIIASRQVRIENVAKEYQVSQKEAKRRIIQTESERRVFIRKYFNADIDDPSNYDLVINTDILTVDAAVSAIRGVLKL